MELMSNITRGSDLCSQSVASHYENASILEDAGSSEED